MWGLRRALTPAAGPCEAHIQAPLVASPPIPTWCELRSGHTGRHEAALPGGGTIAWPTIATEQVIEFGPCPDGDTCTAANCDGTDLGHELAVDFPAATARATDAEGAWRRSLDMARKVDQTIFAGDAKRQGNCLSAAVATFLSIQLEQVPHFADYEPDETNAWWHLLIGFMAGRGLWPTELDDPSDAEPDEIVFVCGPSERGFLHQVLYRDGKLWHDPHPSRAGVLAVTEVLAWRPTRHDHQATP